MRVLVTGAKGFAGRHTVRRLQDSGHTVFLLDLPSAIPRDSDAEFGCDLRDPDKLKKVIDTVRPDACLHLGGIAFVPMGWTDPETVFSVNLIGAIHLLEAFRQISPSTRILVVSSAELYGRHPTEDTVTEETPAHPDNLYGVSKLSADLMALLYFRRYQLPVMTARPINHIGPGQSTQFVCTSFATQVADIALGRKDPFIRVGNLDSRRDFLDVRDVAHAYQLLLEKGKPGVAYNIASGNIVSVRHILDHLCRQAGIEPTIEIDPARFRPTDRHPVLDTTRIRTDTGWQPVISIEQSLDDIYRDIVNRKSDPSRGGDA